ncbi:hypothetical protein ESCO_005602 [Escovopsis weberi]|uniref:WSC domain-containing protein n=1 Tax=Escovopsis weberi TaxID=150374 RepID=A0A0M8MV29_ESCWE|nr:hypothetical protein ESCO_005602 [Escovopsis weberi]
MQYALIAVLAAQAVLGHRYTNMTVRGVAANSTRHALQLTVMGDFRLQGCEVAQTVSPDFQEVAATDEMSVDYCAEKCNSEYFGVSDSLAKSSRAVDDAMCNTPCPGNADQVCGGTMRVGQRIKNERRQSSVTGETVGGQGNTAQGMTEEIVKGQPQDQTQSLTGEQARDERRAEEPAEEEEEEEEEEQETEEEEQAQEQVQEEPAQEAQAQAQAEVQEPASPEIEVQAQAEAEEAIFSLYRRFRSARASSNATARARPMASLHALNATAHNASLSAAGAAAEAEACTHGYSNDTRGERVCHDGKGQRKGGKGGEHGRPYGLAVVNGAAVAGASSLLSSIALAIALL